MSLRKLAYYKILSVFICVYTLLSVNISFLCLDVNAEENTDPVYTETYLYDLIRDEMIPGIGDPDKASFDRLVGQAIRNPVAVEPVFGGGSIGFGIGEGFSAIELGRKMKGLLPSGTSTSPVIHWCNGVPYAYDGSDGTYYCIPPELYPQINDPNFWGGRPPWGDPMQQGEIDVNALTNIPWIYLEDPKTNGVDDEFVDLARRALGLVDSEDGIDGTQWTTGSWCSYNYNRKPDNAFYYVTTDLDLTKCYMIVEYVREESNGYTAIFRPSLYYAEYDSSTNRYWWKLQEKLVPAHTAGYNSYIDSDKNKHVENYRFNVMYTFSDFPLVIDGNTYYFESDRIPFGGITTPGSIPLWYSSGSSPFSPGSFYDGDDVDGYWDDVGDVVGGLSPQQYENLPTTSTGNKKVPVDDPTNYPDTNVNRRQPISILPPSGGDNGGGDNGGGDNGGGDNGGGDNGGGDNGGGDNGGGGNGGDIGDFPNEPEIPPFSPDSMPELDLDGLKEVFPFCIPFDIYGAIMLFNYTSEHGLVFDIPLHLEISGHVILDYTLHIDVESFGFDGMFIYLRAVMIIAYIIGLMILSLKVLQP